MVHVHSDQVGVVIIHPKAVKTNLSSCWSGQQNRQLSAETTGTFILTRQDHIWRGLKAQKTTDYDDYYQREHVPLFFWMGYLLIKSLLKSNSGIFVCKNWWGGRCLWIASHEFAARRWAWDLEPTRSGGTSEFMAKKVQKNDVIFRQISGFNRVLFSPFPWENDPGCQIVFIWRLKPTNSDTIVLHFAGNLNICVSFFYAWNLQMHPHPSIFCSNICIHRSLFTYTLCVFQYVYICTCGYICILIYT